MVITGGKAIGTIGFKRAKESRRVIVPSLKHSTTEFKGSEKSFEGQEGVTTPHQNMGRSHRVILPDE